jgi:hypothetical protein
MAAETIQRDGFSYQNVDALYSKRYKTHSDTYDVRLNVGEISAENIPTELMRIMDGLASELTHNLDSENDRIGLHIEHPELNTSAIDIPFQRPKHLHGHVIFTHISKVLMSNESLAMDGKLRLTVQIVKGVQGNGMLTKNAAVEFNNYLKRTHGIISIENNDRLCLPRAIVVGRAFIQYAKEKTISRCIFRKITGEYSKSRQGTLARELCEACGFDITQFNSGEKTFGMDEVRIFADFLAPSYGISVRNSHTANCIVFESPGLTGNENVRWINLLNLNDHFDPITKPSGFFDTHYWCSLCNRGYSAKRNHQCVKYCTACKSLDVTNCDFRQRNTHCNVCNRDFFGDACLAKHKTIEGKKKLSTCDSLHCCDDCCTEFAPQATHKCGFSTCNVCKKYASTDHECFMQPHKFADETAYETAGADEDKIKKADGLALERQRKSRYVVWDLETYALNQESGKGRLIPHLLVASTVCFKCLDSPFKQQLCSICNGLHDSCLCLSNDAWNLDNSSCKTSSWSDTDPCSECGQQQIVIRSGCETDLFKLFFEWLLRPSMCGFSLVAHNGAGFDSPYLLRHLISDNGLYADTIFSGSKLLQLLAKRSTKAKKIFFRCIDSVQFFQSALSALPKQFGLDTTDLKKGFFPYKFDKPVHWNYIGLYPDLEFYAPREKNSKDAKELVEWHTQQSNNVFHFRKDMLDYCIQDVRVLLSAIQASVKEDLIFMGFDGMAETCTTAAKTMMFYRHSFLKADSIGVIPQDGYGGHRNQSKEGMLWLMYQEAEFYPGLQHARSVRGEKIVCGFPVDGFHAETQTVLQFHGCFFHGCKKCYTDGLLTNNVSGESFEALRTKTMKRTQKMRKAGFNVIEKWSCEFTDDEKQRARDLEVDKHLPQLVPKDGFYGGRTEAVNLRYSAEEFKGGEIRYYDVTSEYPFVNARKYYPVGHPITLFKHQLPQSNEDWSKACIFGMVKCSITPPPSLLHPVLPYRHQSSLLFPLCRSCCHEKHEGFCTHSNAERTLHGTWVTIEIDKAIEMGYKLEEVQEAMHFEEKTNTLFDEFINCLYKTKLEASGFPHGVDSVDQKRAYIADILMHEHFAMDIDKISCNPGRRQMAKILLNSFWVRCLFIYFSFIFLTAVFLFCS